MMKPLDLCRVSLAPATTLIEASAGTGKTYSITGLMIRLLLETDVTIGQIVAVTFTEAATQELRERTRRRVADALADLRAGRSEDPVLQTYLKSGDIAKGEARLNVALNSFDEAQIFTIHGFCQRCLSDYAFESGARFDTELSIDAIPFYEEIAHDFWRRQFYGHNPLLAAIIIAWKQSPTAWVELLERTARHPDLVIEPPAEQSAATDLIAHLGKIFAALRGEWRQETTQIRRILMEDRGLKRAKDKFFHPDRVAEILSKLTLICERFEDAAPENLEVLSEVTAEAIAAGTRSASTPPAHRFFSLCTGFCATVDAFFNRLTRDFLVFAGSELPKRKAQTNTITYDDLILGLRDALRAGERGATLAESIGQRYQAALIDEFQDTDPAQYEIFRTIFGAGKHSLFYIGDPKQSIYGFRGADIFTYRAAATAAQWQAYTLTTNWRSEPKLLSALNALFSRTTLPFVFDWINYHDVQAPARPKVTPLTGASHGRGAALHLRLSAAPDGEPELSQKDAAALVSAQVAADIGGLFTERASLASRPLGYRDVAVLVRTKAQAETVQGALRQAGIRSILQTENSVFAAPEAKELDRFLQGVLEPRRNTALKSALATTLLGLDAQALYELELDDTKRQFWLEQFLGWREQWVNGCFIAMFRRLLVRQAVRTRLVRLPGGERRLTNFLQLAELLHEAETSQHLAPDAVCAFLSKQHSNERMAQEHYQLRLESDEDAVQIVTVHKAKGLEYPVVFCPFLWPPAEKKNDRELLYHDRDNDDLLTFDLRGKRKDGADKAKEWQSEEIRSEELRLAYVALTRAMNRCYVYVPAVKEILKSPLAHLLAADQRHSIPEQIQSLVAAARGSIDAAQVSGGCRRVQRSEQGEAPLALTAREFSGRISQVGLSASFTGLNADVELDQPVAPVEQADPSSAAEAIPANPEATIFTFPRGASAGDFFHDVLENVDAAQPEPMEALVSNKLRLHGFSNPAFPPVICAVLRNLLALELEPGIHLAEVPAQDILRELDFTYPLKHLTPARFREILSRCPEIPGAVSERMGRLQFRPVEGFMRGFIDVLFRAGERFYIIDWKSNWLGARATDYQPAQVRAEMLLRNYYLQYHLYTLAVDLFLRTRLPGYDYDKHFGGVFYVFLRGVTPRQAELGVFRDRPSAQTVATLHELLP
jgi:exodeoxyribonuclease V beta subunit